jgi:hypothetical protein
MRHTLASVRPKTWVLASFIVATVAALVVAFAPLGTACSFSATPGGPPGEEVCRHVSIFSNDGSWVLVVVAVPVLIALIPVLLRHRVARVVAAAFLWVFSIVGLMSVGLFFVPAAVLMTLAAAQRGQVPLPPVPVA